jgi:uncharacterized protein (TIGR00369 family)
MSMQQESSAPRSFGVVPPKDLASISGLEFLRGMMEGRYPFPPIAEACDMEPVEVDHGYVAFEARAGERFLNPLGTIHGGWSSTLLDTVMACAVHSTLSPGRAYATLEFKIHFVRPILASTGTIRAEGKVIHAGGQVATSEGRIVDRNGKILAHGTETCLIFDVGQRA